MNIILSQPDPDDPQVDVESERNRLARRAQLEQQLRSDEIATKRAARLDKYFSQHPPNGPTISIYREVLATFVNSSGETPRWLTYPQLFASFERLEKRGVLKIEMRTDELNIRHYKSQSTANRRNVRPPALDKLVADLKHALGDSLQRGPAIPHSPPVHGCRYVPTINKWRVSLYFGGVQRALGCYPFETAIRLQDVLALHFTPYRLPGSFNTSVEHAAELLTKHPALAAFCIGLEKFWLETGVLVKPGELQQTLESRVREIEKKLDILIKLSEVPPA